MSFRYCYGKVQIPIVIDSTTNKLYVGYYNKLLYLSPGMCYKQSFDILFETMPKYYKDNDVSMNSNYKIINFINKK